MNSGDNRIFNVNGYGDKFLQSVLELAFQQHDGGGCVAWTVSEKGLILLWHADERASKLIAELSAAAITPMVLAWLKSPEAKAIKLTDWDANVGHDGHNVLGWRVFCEDWGHVSGFHAAICAITPAYIWMGK